MISGIGNSCGCNTSGPPAVVMMMACMSGNVDGRGYAGKTHQSVRRHTRGKRVTLSFAKAYHPAALQAAASCISEYTAPCGWRVG
ncbi:MAG: hypothetical protein CO017_00955 [Zetaproteobacteria bacterium CG_4_8_14_3_um_filter_59_5]|nr:MAG: hypothetical protein CO017_00955 [Zetaproteobacteria bacterium CG_4_8_14_3_um_filter_59_5]